MSAQKIIIDTDPGQDDAVAILTALASPEDLEVLGIVAVAGNVPLALNARNALKIVEIAQRTEIPVYAGCPHPLMRPLVTAEHVHGRTGLDGPDLPDPHITLQSQHGVQFLIETLRQEPAGTVTLCTLGPLTNIAAALAMAPDIGPRVQRIVMMGGAYFEVGNTTPAAEFNIYVDPEAAAAVFASGIPIVMAPLDVTHKVLTTPERLEAFAGLGNRAGAIVADMLGFSQGFDLKKYNWAGAPLHDPCVMAWLLRPQIFTGRDINVMVETASPLTRGMTVADFWGLTERAPNVYFLHDVDAGAYYGLLRERIARLP